MRHLPVVAAVLLASLVSTAPSVALTLGAARRAPRAMVTAQGRLAVVHVPHVRRGPVDALFPLETPARVGAEPAPLAVEPAPSVRPAPPVRAVEPSSLDRDAAEHVLLSVVDVLGICRVKGGEGPGTAVVTAAPDGGVRVVLSPPLPGHCRGRLYRPPFRPRRGPFLGGTVHDPGPLRPLTQFRVSARNPLAGPALPVHGRPVSRSWFGLALALVAGVAFACNSAELQKGSSSGASGEEAPSPDGQTEDDAGGGQRPGEQAVLDGGVLPMTKAVTIQVQPSDNGAAILAALKGAKKSIHMTMYLLSDSAMIKALGDAKAAGREVKVVLNQTFPANEGSNQTTFNTLKSRGVDVVWAPPGYAYTHAKSIAIDGQTLLVMTMNLTESSPSTNREYIATDTEPQDVADFETIFQGDFTNASTSLNGNLVLSPQSASSLDARQRLVALIAKAKITLDVEVQSISDSGIVDAMIAAQQAGVKTRLVIDGNFAPSPSQSDAVTKMKAAGIPIRALKNPDIHAKTIVADGAYAFVGSQNFTSNALFNNREVGLIVDNAAEVAKITDAIGKDFATGTAL